MKAYRCSVLFTLRRLMFSSVWKVWPLICECLLLVLLLPFWYRCRRSIVNYVMIGVINISVSDRLTEITVCLSSSLVWYQSYWSTPALYIYIYIYICISRYDLFTIYLYRNTDVFLHVYIMAFLFIERVFAPAPSPLTGKQYTESWSRNTPRVVTARVYYVLEGSLTPPPLNNSVDTTAPFNVVIHPQSCEPRNKSMEKFRPLDGIEPATLGTKCNALNR